MLAGVQIKNLLKVNYMYCINSNLKFRCYKLRSALTFEMEMDFNHLQLEYKINYNTK